MSERLTLATSSGFPLVVLAFHVAMGVIGLASGSIAIAARKGGTLHRRSGQVFVGAMVAMGLTAVAIAFVEGKDDVAGGALTAYLIFTAWSTVRPLRAVKRAVDIPLMGGGGGRLRRDVRTRTHRARASWPPDRGRACGDDVLPGNCLRARSRWGFPRNAGRRHTGTSATRTASLANVLRPVHRDGLIRRAAHEDDVHTQLDAQLASDPRVIGRSDRGAGLLDVANPR